MAQLGANAFGEVLVPGRVPDCCLGLRLDRSAAIRRRCAGGRSGRPAHPVVPQPDGTVLYELVTGQPERDAGVRASS